MARNSHLFSLKDCKFKVEKHKLGTARVVAWKEFKITNSFTLENSFHAYDYGEDEIREFTVRDYRGMGEDIGKGVWEYK
jgi:hypothetical protein